ncbi:MAG: hypothetical protein QM627_01930 [Luteolibacter sp.]
MKRIQSFFVLVALAGVSLLSSSCVFMGESPMSPEALQRRGLKPNEGYIVATFHTKEVAPDSRIPRAGVLPSVHIKGESATSSKIVSLIPISIDGQNHPYFAGGGKPSVELAIPVSAGDYKITGWTLDNGQIVIRNRKPLDVHFQVIPGKATYIGSYLALSRYGRNLLGLPVLGDGVILVKDDFSTDRAKIPKKFPMIQADSIRKSDVPRQYQAEMKRIADTPRLLGMF